jgi:hypothetical protein
MALDDYANSPSQDCLARLFDAVNAIDLSSAPLLTRNEKLVMRSSDRKDIFWEKHNQSQGHHTVYMNGTNTGSGSKSVLQHKSTHSGGSYSSVEDGSRRPQRSHDDVRLQERASSLKKQRNEGENSGTSQPHGRQESPESSFALGGDVVWVNEEHSVNGTTKENVNPVQASSTAAASSSTVASSRKRRSTDASSLASQAHSLARGGQSYFEPSHRTNVPIDTHFYHTYVAYKDHHLPIKMPLSTFPQEVGDVSAPMIAYTGLRLIFVVFTHHPHQGVFLSSVCNWAYPPSSSYQWTSNTPYHCTL